MTKKIKKFSEIGYMGEFQMIDKNGNVLPGTYKKIGGTWAMAEDKTQTRMTGNTKIFA
jgi:hypothetical protein